MTPRISAVVPTLGLSPWLGTCLEALRREGGPELEILLVAQGAKQPPEAVLALADRTFRLDANAGFAAANNLALAEARGDLLATVNDDAVVEEGWLQALVMALDGRPEVAAVQGLQVQLDAPDRVDGCGLAWNRWWQAVQIGHGELAEHHPADREPFEVFGVSATAALYRRPALVATGGPRLAAFDERLFAYYEDVDLAWRLRAAGYRALSVPAARARHAGSQSGRQMAARHRLIYANRHLVLARLLGRAYWPRLPGLVLRDLADLGRALGRGELAAAGGVAAAGLRVARRLPGFLRFGPSAISLPELRRFRRGFTGG